MRYCETCGNELPDGQKFCQNCGTPLENADPFENIATPQAQPDPIKEQVHQKGWFVILWCVLFPPVGALLIYLNKEWDADQKKKLYIAVAIWFGIIVLRNLLLIKSP